MNRQAASAMKAVADHGAGVTVPGGETATKV